MRTVSVISNSQTFFTTLDSAMGPLLLVGVRDDVGALALRGIYFAGKAHAAKAPPDDAREDRAAFAPAMTQLGEYFDGTRTQFDLALAPQGTQFQQTVWAALREIPYGQTTTYSQIAREIGRPAAVRAVGGANGKNPLSIVVPCHRVIGRDGALTGYAGGVERKERLLEIEKLQG